ncbi:transporter substrate-binding domain-containing protein [Micromonospora sp. DT233]|uniref:transporter substrate-binding domain-containing protein n=1 Tax=Micromonospora sp. DT233 TaxID=3393432 RepID=UPI003CF3466C
MTTVVGRRTRRSGSAPLRAGLVGALLLVPAACTAAPPSPAVAPSAVPSAVSSATTSDKASNDICTVRSSYPPSETPPGGVHERGLVVGVDPSDATMSYWNAKEQQFEGFNIDLVVALAELIWPKEDPRKRITFKMVPPGGGAFAMLEADHPDRVDFIATSLTASCARAEQVLFSNDYLDSGQTALVRRRGGDFTGAPEYAGMDQLGGRKVCAAAQTTSLAAIAGYRTAGGERLVPVQAAHPIDCLVMLRQGQVDAVSTDENILLGFARMAPDTVLVTEPPRDNTPFCRYHNGKSPCTWFTDEPHAFAFARGNPESLELLRFVNHALESTRASVWATAHQRWLKGHPDRGMPSPGPAVTSWPPG